MVDAIELSQAPKISLAGRQWAIPELAVRQIMRLVPTMGRLHAAGGQGGEAFGERELAWIYDIAYVALTRAYPELTREAFDDMPVRIHEIMAALPIIARQAGLEFKEPSSPGED